MNFVYAGPQNPEVLDQLVAFYNERMGEDGEHIDPQTCSAIAVMVGEPGAYTGFGVVLYTNHMPGVDVQMHTAGNGNWLNRESLRVFFAYPFEQMRCRRVTALVSSNHPLIKGAKLPKKGPGRPKRRANWWERAGFKREGVVREAARDGGNIVVYGMLARECRWLHVSRETEDMNDGQIEPERANAA